MSDNPKPGEDILFRSPSSPASCPAILTDSTGMEENAGMERVSAGVEAGELT